MTSPTSKVFQPNDYLESFNPEAYLNHYFSKESIEDGTRVSLFALPVFAQILVQQLRPHERQSLLDIGAGPTVYSALCFRDVVREVHMADYVEGNLKLLREWLNKESQHDWKPTIRVIRRTEGGIVDEADVENCEEKARSVLKSGGIHFADVHQDTVVPALGDRQFDVLLSIFTLESACKTYAKYCACLANMMKNLRSGGRFILGSVLEDDEYNSGRQVIFSLLFLSETQILEALESVGINLDSIKKYVLPDEGVMFLMGTKN